MTIQSKIPKELLARYMAYEATSEEVARVTGNNPASIRRAIRRTPPEAAPKSKANLIQARKAFRRTLANLKLHEIMELAHVSLSTAARIKRKGVSDV